MQWRRFTGRRRRPPIQRASDGSAVAAVPRPVAATPLPRRAVAEVPRSRVVAAVPRSRGRATAGPLCGQAATSPKPRGGGTSKAGEQATPVDVRVATATHEARARCSSERRHERREMRAAMIAVTSSDPAQFSFRLLCFMPTTCIIYAKNCMILCFNTEFVYHARWKDNSLIYVVRNLRACNGNSHDFAIIFGSV
jgi:hypothetical protein